MAKSKGLGRGLDALFGDEARNAEPHGIKINDIEQNTSQPRRVFDEAALNELAESIRQNGVITPIAVRKTGDTFQIIAGERRWRAARMAGLSHIPAVVFDIDEHTAYQYALVENLQREDLNPVEEAQGFQRLMDDFELTQEQAAEKVGKSRSAVANSIRLLSLPVPVRQLLEDGKLSAGHARALLGLASESAIADTAQKVLAGGLNVRQTEALVRSLASEKKPREAPADVFYIKELERQMQKDTGHKVSISHGRKKGRLTIEYYGNEDLEKICEALNKLEK